MSQDLVIIEFNLPGIENMLNAKPRDCVSP